eukprot:INCI17407.4.p1 GENE.INCI17407.4~~INCI17407.4.p1  ORF type:complete len:1377 (-),score=222.28 INCI17407.4:164-4273(-)
MSTSTTSTTVTSTKSTTTSTTTTTATASSTGTPAESTLVSASAPLTPASTARISTFSTSTTSTTTTTTTTTTSSTDATKISTTSLASTMSSPTSSTTSPCIDGDTVADLLLRDARTEIHEACLSVADDPDFLPKLYQFLFDALGYEFASPICGHQVMCGSINVSLWFEDTTLRDQVHRDIQNEFYNTTSRETMIPFDYLVSDSEGATVPLKFAFEVAAFVEATSTTTPTTRDCVGAWSAWSACSTSCGTGTQSRIFTHVTRASGTGAACSVGDGTVANIECVDQPCEGSSVVTLDLDLSEPVDDEDLYDAIRDMIEDDGTISLDDVTIVIGPSVDTVQVASSYTERDAYVTTQKVAAVMSYVQERDVSGAFQLSTTTEPAEPAPGDSVSYHLNAVGVGAAGFFSLHQAPILGLLCSDEGTTEAVEQCVDSSSVSVTQSTVSVSLVAGGDAAGNVDTLVSIVENDEGLVGTLQENDPGSYSDLAITSNSQTQSNSVATDPGTQEDDLTMIIVVVCVLLVIILLIVVVLIVLRKQKRGKQSRHLHPEMEPMVIGTTKLRGDLTSKAVSRAGSLSRSASLTRAGSLTRSGSLSGPPILGPRGRSNSGRRIDDEEGHANVPASRSSNRRKVGVAGMAPSEDSVDTKRFGVGPRNRRRVGVAGTVAVGREEEEGREELSIQRSRSHRTSSIDDSRANRSRISIGHRGRRRRGLDQDHEAEKPNSDSPRDDSREWIGSPEADDMDVAHERRVGPAAGRRRRLGANATSGSDARVDTAEISREANEEHVRIGALQTRRRARVGVVGPRTEGNVGVDMSAGDVAHVDSEDRVSVSFNRTRRPLNKAPVGLAARRPAAEPRRVSYAQEAAMRDSSHALQHQGNGNSESAIDPAGTAAGVRKTRVGPSRRRLDGARRGMLEAAAGAAGMASSSGPRRRLAAPSAVESSETGGERPSATTAAVRTLSHEVEHVKSSVAKTRVGPSRRQGHIATVAAPASAETVHAVMARADVSPRRRAAAAAPVQAARVPTVSLGANEESSMSPAAPQRRVGPSAALIQPREEFDSVEAGRVNVATRSSRPISAAVGRTGPGSRPISAVSVGVELELSSESSAASSAASSPVARRRLPHTLLNAKGEDTVLAEEGISPTRGMGPRSQRELGQNPLNRSVEPSGTNVTRTHIGPQRRRAAPARPLVQAEDNTTNADTGTAKDLVSWGERTSSEAEPMQHSSRESTPEEAPDGAIAPTIGPRRARAPAVASSGRIGPQRTRLNASNTAQVVGAVDLNNADPQTAGTVRVGPGRSNSRRGVHRPSNSISDLNADVMRLGPGRRQRDREASVATTEAADISVTADTSTMIQSTRIGPTRGNRRRRGAAPPPPSR